MRTISIFCFFILSCFAGYSQLVVESTFVNSSNKFNSEFVFASDANVNEDLFFSIGPSGLPQYGKLVSWNLPVSSSSATARFFHVKKGDWDRSAVQSHEEIVPMNIISEEHSTEENPNIELGDNWIRLGSSWNFSHDNIAIAIISFTCQDKGGIKKGTIRFSHPDQTYIDVTDAYIYNDWAEHSTTYYNSGRKYYEYSYQNLQPGEIRHLYLMVDISNKESRALPSTLFEAEMVGFQSSQLITDGIIPPHDPNSLVLVNAFENTDIMESCESYSLYPELEEACNVGQPFWVNCPRLNDLKCPYDHSLYYPYCNIDSELLTYRISCFNDGKGIARHIDMECMFDSQNTPFEDNLQNYTGSHNVTADYLYPNVMMNFENINLPGLNSPETVYTYDQCSAYATFSVQTLCDQRDIINASAKITFYSLDNSYAGTWNTNNVKIVPEQGIYTNYEPECISCTNEELRNSNSSKNILAGFINNSLHLSLKRESEKQPINVKIFTLSGQVLKTLNIESNGSIQLDEYIDVSELKSGIYFISVQDGNKNYVEKFVYP